jgi:hypothetical protein
MEYLLEARWDDPIADAIGHILRTMPPGVEQTTGDVPLGLDRAFVVYRSDSSEILDTLVRAVSKVGAQVRITPIARQVPRAAA